jgi:hypothetical protein
VSHFSKKYKYTTIDGIINDKRKARHKRESLNL